MAKIVKMKKRAEKKAFRAKIRARKKKNKEMIANHKKGDKNVKTVVITEVNSKEPYCSSMEHHIFNVDVKYKDKDEIKEMSLPFDSYFAAVDWIKEDGVGSKLEIGVY